MKIGDVINVTKSVGSNYYTDANGLIWIEIGDPKDVGGVYVENGVTGTISKKDGQLVVTVNECYQVK